MRKTYEGSKAVLTWLHVKITALKRQSNALAGDIDDFFDYFREKGSSALSASDVVEEDKDGEYGKKKHEREDGKNAEDEEMPGMSAKRAKT